MQYNSIYHKKNEKFQIDWDIINSLNSIYNFYFNIKELNINNPEPKLPLNIIEMIQEELDKNLPNKNIKLEKSDNLFKLLKEKYNVPYSQLQKILISLIPMKKLELKEISKNLIKTENTIKEKILNSNKELFVKNLKRILEPQGYFVEDYGDNISIRKEGTNKGQLYKKEDGTYYLKAFSPSLGSIFSGFTSKTDNIYLSDIAKCKEIDINDYIEIEKPEQIQKNIYILKNSLFDEKEFSDILKIEQSTFQDENSMFNEFKNEYIKRFNLIENKKLSEIKSSQNIEIYKSVFSDKLFEKEIGFSFDKEMYKYEDKIEGLKQLKIKIKENFKEEDLGNIPEYFNLLLMINILDTLENRTKVFDAINTLKNNNNNNVLEILSFFNLKNLNIEKIKLAESKYNENKESIEPQTQRLFELVFALKDDIDIKKYTYFIQEQEVRFKLSKSFFENIEEFRTFLRNFKNTEDVLSLEEGVSKNINNISNKLVENFNLFFDKSKVPFLSANKNEMVENNLKVIDSIEKHYFENEKFTNNNFKESIVYTSTSRLFLLMYSIKNDFDLTCFEKYFFKKDNLNTLVDKLKNYMEKENPIIKIPLEIEKFQYILTDELRKILFDYMKNNNINFDEDNFLFINNKSLFNSIYNGNTTIVKDYVLLKRFVIQNYDKMSIREKNFIEKNGFDTFFFDYNSLVKSEIFLKIKETVNKDSVLFKNNLEKLQMIEERILKQTTLEKSVLIEIKILQILQIMKNLIDNKNLEQVNDLLEKDSLLKNIFDLIKKELNSEVWKKKYENGVMNLSDEDIVISKLHKISFFSPNLKEEISNYLSETFDFNSLLKQESIDLKLPLKIKKNENSFETRHFMLYSLNNLKSEQNRVIKYRTRYSQLTFLVLQIAKDVLENKFFQDKYLPYFKSLESLNQFKELIENSKIIEKNQHGFIVPTKEQKYLRNFIFNNKMEIEDMIKNFQGYVPDGLLQNFIIEDLKELAKEEPYIVDMLGITKNSELSYVYSILTPEIILSDEKNKGGMVTGYNLRVTNKKTMDREKINKVFISYFNGQQFSYLKKHFNVTNYSTFLSEVEKTTVDELVEILEQINIKLKEKELYFIDYIETPKEPMTKSIITSDINLEEDSKLIKKIPSIFVNSIAIRNLKPEEEVVIHLNEGVKDGMSLSSILKHSENKNQIVLPLQGTKGFKDEFASLLFNLSDKKTIIKCWADTDYAGLTLLIHLQKLIKEKFPNVEIVAMNEMTYENGVKELIDEKGFDKIKGMDLTDWSIDKNTTKIYKKEQSKIIDNFNKPFDTESDFYKRIAFESLELEIEKWKEQGVNKKELEKKVEKYLEDLNINIKNEFYYSNQISI